jgi:hypothetical protein
MRKEGREFENCPVRTNEIVLWISEVMRRSIVSENPAVASKVRHEITTVSRTASVGGSEKLSLMRLDGMNLNELRERLLGLNRNEADVSFRSPDRGENVSGLVF